MTWGPVIFNTLDPKGWVLISLTHRNLCQVWCTGFEHLWLFYSRLKTGVLSLFWLFITHSPGCCTCMWVSDKALIYYFMYDENIVAVWNMSHWVSFTVFPAKFWVFGSVSVSSWGGSTCVCLSVTFASVLSSPSLHYCTPSHFEPLSPPWCQPPIDIFGSQRDVDWKWRLMVTVILICPKGCFLWKVQN